MLLTGVGCRYNRHPDDDTVERMAGSMKTQQEKIENLTERVLGLKPHSNLLAQSHRAKIPVRKK